MGLLSGLSSVSILSIAPFLAQVTEFEMVHSKWCKKQKQAQDTPIL
jgi:hypothetical protein